MVWLIAPSSLASAQEPCLDLAHYDQRKPDLVANSEPGGEFGVSSEEIGEPVRVDRDPHFHLFRSIFRWEPTGRTRGRLPRMPAT